MSDSGPTVLPTSWRDTYQLVRDTRDDVLGAVEGVGSQVTSLDERLNRHLLDHAAEVGQRKGEARILGLGRSSIALTISILSGFGVVAALIRG